MWLQSLCDSMTSMKIAKSKKETKSILITAFPTLMAWSANDSNISKHGSMMELKTQHAPKNRTKKTAIIPTTYKIRLPNVSASVSRCFKFLISLIDLLQWFYKCALQSHTIVLQNRGQSLRQSARLLFEIQTIPHRQTPPSV